MKLSVFLAGSMALTASAFPSVLRDVVNQRSVPQKRSLAELHARSEEEKANLPSPTVFQKISRARGNCGVFPCLTFDADVQRVSNTGENAYASPYPDQIRGPCPGLNAAANHGYLPRSGVTTIPNTITGLGAMYGMSIDLAGFLAAYAIIFDGDPVLGTWSIGGPQQGDPLTKGLLGQPQGISWSHNNYEGDSSIGRCDAYINHGDAYSLSVDRFRSAYAATDSRYPGLYTLDSFAQNFAAKVQESISDNPYYFAAPFSTTLVAPAAYNFVINFMSNHTAENPSGYLDGETFKTFFAVVGDKPEDFKWLPGQERMPDNWYKRTPLNEYNAINVFTDLVPQFLAYPSSFRLGGNVDGVNTYAGISLTDFTSGALNLTDLLDTTGQGGVCYMAQLVQALIPNVLDTPIQLVTPILDLVNQFVKPLTGNLSCVEVGKYDQTLFNNFPGHFYQPAGPSSN